MTTVLSKEYISPYLGLPKYLETIVYNEDKLYLTDKYLSSYWSRLFRLKTKGHKIETSDTRNVHVRLIGWMGERHYNLGV